MTHVTTFRDKPPRFHSMFGGDRAHPEFVGTSCARCDRVGYVHEDTAWEADDANEELICRRCDEGLVDFEIEVSDAERSELPDDVVSDLYESLARRFEEDFGTDVDVSVTMVRPGERENDARSDVGGDDE